MLVSIFNNVTPKPCVETARKPVLYKMRQRSTKLKKSLSQFTLNDQRNISCLDIAKVI